MIPLLALLILLLAAIPAHAMLITEWSLEYVYLGQVGNSTDPSQPFNMYQVVHKELVYDVTELGGVTLVSSHVIPWEEYTGHMPGGPPTASPEPLTLGLLGGTLAVVGWVARRRGKR